MQTSVRTLLLLFLTSSVSPQRPEQETITPGPEAPNSSSCTFLLLAPFTTDERNEYERERYRTAGASFLAASQLAVNHLNERIDTVVPDLSTLMLDRDRCADSNFTVVAVDTNTNAQLTLERLVRATRDIPNLCGLVGPFENKRQSTTLSFSQAVHLPQFLVNGRAKPTKDVGETLVAGYLNIDDYFYLFADYAHQYMGLEYITFMGGGAKKGQMMRDAFDFHFGVVDNGASEFEGAFSFEMSKEWEYSADALALKRTGIHNIFLSPDRMDGVESLIGWAQALDKHRMLDGSYQYFLYEDAVHPNEINELFPDGILKDSPIARLLHGAGWFSEIDPFSKEPVNDPFASSMQSLDLSLLQYPEGADPVEGTYFVKNLPYRHSSFVYDSIISLGLGSCPSPWGGEGNLGTNNHAGEGNRNGNHTADDNDSGEVWDSKQNGRQPLKPPKKQHPLIQKILELPTFRGASGLLNYELHGMDDDKVRALSGFSIAMYNFRIVDDDKEGFVKVESHLVSIRRSGETDWEHLQPFVFANSLEVAPIPQLTIDDENLLTKWVFSLGMTLFVIGVALVVAAVVAVHCLRAEQQIRLAQPPFLKLICFGSLFELLSIVTLSVDEGVLSASGAAIDFACGATVWFFFIGHALIYSAIFCKLWRVDQVMQFRRNRKVTVLQTLWPVAVVIFTAILILLLWTLLDPWHWERDFVSYYPPETLGKCTSDNLGVFFGSLAGILVLCTFITMLAVWKTKDLAQDLSDTSTVFYLILTQLQAWFIGLPILAVVDESEVDSVYLGRILLIWIFAMAPILIVLLPRVCKAIRSRRSPQGGVVGNRSRVHITGLNIPNAHQSAATPSSRPTSGTSNSTQTQHLIQSAKKTHVGDTVTVSSVQSQTQRTDQDLEAKLERNSVAA